MGIMWEKYVSEFGFLKDICLSIFEIIIAKKKDFRQHKESDNV